MPTGSLSEPASPIRMGSREKMARSHHHDEQSGQHFLHRFRTMPDWTDRSPDATFDLHGQTVLEAVTNAERFLRAQARARPGGVVRLITGRGRARGRRAGSDPDPEPAPRTQGIG